MFDWKWRLSDIQRDKSVTVFSVFSGIGGSSLGYKRAGFEIIGNVELDSVLNKMYCANLRPKYNYNMDVRNFNQLENLPRDLYNLDILDGSPPCTPFTMIGKREKGWGKEKIFFEGQKKQRLDLLAMTFLDTVEKLRPKIVVLENVPGIIIGKARGYVNQIINRFKALGYEVQLFYLNACFMDVPQNRPRIFFIANNQHYPRLKLDFHGKLIPFGEVREARGKQFTRTFNIVKRLSEMLPSDNSIASITLRTEGIRCCFVNGINHDWNVASCLTKAECYRGYDKSIMTIQDRARVATFPLDYNFSGGHLVRALGYTVPPNMMANIAVEIYRQWLRFEVEA